jgi:hypothetical protein
VSGCEKRESASQICTPSFVSKSTRRFFEAGCENAEEEITRDERRRERGRKEQKDENLIVVVQPLTIALLCDITHFSNLLSRV